MSDIRREPKDLGQLLQIDIFFSCVVTFENTLQILIKYFNNMHLVNNEEGNDKQAFTINNFRRK